MKKAILIPFLVSLSLFSCGEEPIYFEAKEISVRYRLYNEIQEHGNPRYKEYRFEIDEDLKEKINAYYNDVVNDKGKKAEDLYVGDENITDFVVSLKNDNQFVFIKFEKDNYRVEYSVYDNDGIKKQYLKEVSDNALRIKNNAIYNQLEDYLADAPFEYNNGGHWHF